MTLSPRLLVAMLVASFVTTGANATIIFSATPSGTGDNVVFNLQPPDQTGLTIFGNLNDPLNTLVQFESTQTITSPSGGQARIESVPDGILNNLVTTIPGFYFGQAVFNLDATADGTATIIAQDQFGGFFDFALPLSSSGQNFFTLTTADGQLISQVAFTTTVGLDDVQQVRFGGAVPIPGPILGAGLPGLALGLAGLVAFARLRRKRLA